MLTSISAFTLVVSDYEAGLAFYVDVLGFTLFEDTDLGDGKRWVLIAPTPTSETRVLLAKAVGEVQTAAIGQQTGGRVGFFLNSDDFDTDYQALKAKGVTFLETPRDEPYAKVVVFQDPFGNKWDLLQSK